MTESASPSAQLDAWTTASLQAGNLSVAHWQAMASAIQAGTFKQITSVLIARHGKLISESYFDGSETKTIEDSFRPRLHPRWRATHVGGGRLVLGEAGLRLLLASAQHSRYADAQIDDYAGLARRNFPWRPPLRMTVRARVSGPLAGTAGFGFWNNPFSPLGGAPALPAAIWFFHAAPPSDMPLALGVPGHGWKVACIDTTQVAALAWLPLGLPVALANQVPAFQRRIWPRIQRALRIAEAPIPAPGLEWRSYTLEWRAGGASFSIDDQVVFATDRAPRGPLGFVAWVDNQWMVATPRGRFGWGLLDAPAQWMDLASVQIEPLERLHVPML